MTDFDQKAYNRAYYLANKERITANVREWQAANPEKVRGYKRKSEDAHPERRARYYQDNREVILGKVKARAEHKAALVLIKRRIWAGEVPEGCIPPWLSEEHLMEMQSFYEEARRLTKETDILHVVDHIEPLVGTRSHGLHVPWNLQVLTDAENKRKRFREDCNF